MVDRLGPGQVPAGHDVAGIQALCAREIKRLETRVVLELEGREKRARAKARLGLPVAGSDTITRRIKSNLSRAHKRMVWAIETFERLRRGVAPATIIDPETGRPLQDPAPAASPTAQEQPPLQPERRYPHGLASMHAIGQVDEPPQLSSARDRRDLDAHGPGPYMATSTDVFAKVRGHERDQVALRGPDALGEIPPLRKRNRRVFG